MKIEFETQKDGWFWEAKELDGGELAYRAEKDGEVLFFVHDLSNETGYGRWMFQVTMTDGEVRTITGPWSSRSFIINAAFPEYPPMDVYYTCDLSHGVSQRIYRRN